MVMCVFSTNKESLTLGSIANTKRRKGGRERGREGGRERRTGRSITYNTNLHKF